MTQKVLPDNISRIALENILKRQILSKSDALIECFDGLIHDTYEPSVETMTISASSPVETDTSGPGFLRHLDGKNKLITTKKSGNFAGDSCRLDFDFPDLPTVGRDIFYDIGYADVLGNIISDWTYDCWLKAGGWVFKIPTILVVYRDAGYGKNRQLTKAIAS